MVCLGQQVAATRDEAKHEVTRLVMVSPSDILAVAETIRNTAQWVAADGADDTAFEPPRLTL